MKLLEVARHVIASEKFVQAAADRIAKEFPKATIKVGQIMGFIRRSTEIPDDYQFQVEVRFPGSEPYSDEMQENMSAAIEKVRSMFPEGNMLGVKPYALQIEHGVIFVLREDDPD